MKYEIIKEENGKPITFGELDEGEMFIFVEYFGTCFGTPDIKTENDDEPDPQTNLNNTPVYRLKLKEE